MFFALASLAAFALLGCVSNQSGVARYRELASRSAGPIESRSQTAAFPVVLASAQIELDDERPEISKLPAPEDALKELAADSEAPAELPERRDESDPVEAGDQKQDREAQDGEEQDSEAQDDETDDDESGESDDEDSDSAVATPAQIDRECFEINPLTLLEVLRSVADSYPLLEVALAELATADGKALATWGSFDSVLSAYSISKPLGFYETYRNGVKLSRPLWNGGEVYGGYRIGRGVFEPWYEERQTNEGGEFKTGIKQPLLKGYAIDGRRAAVRTAELERSRLEPDIQSRIIGMQLVASELYWKWVATGQVVRTQENLVELARQRNETLVKQVEAGDLPKITEIDNGRFISKRQVKLIESRRKLQEASIKLSLFFRDATGQPLVVTDDRMPCDFPAAEIVDMSVVESDIARALEMRPELVELGFQRQKVEVDLCYAKNQLLPKLDAYAETGQDVGEPTSSKRDKSELEIEMGLLAEVPLQRRAASGKIQAAQGKLAQIDAKRRFVEDKIRSQVLDAASALNNAFQRIEQARENLELTQQSLRLGRLRFEEGDIDIIALNIYETSLAEAELLLVDAEFAYYSAQAQYTAALGMDANLESRMQ